MDNQPSEPIKVEAELLQPNSITKTAFVTIIQGIVAFMDEQDAFTDDMAKYFDGHMVCEFGSPLVKAVVDGLERCFKFSFPDDPGGGIIAWWLWDSPKRGLEKNWSRISDMGQKHWYMVDTPELLYEFLTTGRTSVLTTKPEEPPANPNFGKGFQI